ncbi:MAG: hypothetical protein ACQESD_06510 [Thermoplasmatota archaeon]
MNSSIIFTKHADDMLKERNFSKKLIKEVVLNPDDKRKGEGGRIYSELMDKGKEIELND